MRRKQNLPPHLFSINGDTAADGPFGQKILDPSLFIGAISRSWDRSSLALEYLISVFSRCVLKIELLDEFYFHYFGV